MTLIKNKERKRYPKYTREENKGCKLTDSQINTLQHLRYKGATYKDLGKEFGLSISNIRYWCLSDEARKEENKKHYLLSKGSPWRDKERVKKSNNKKGRRKYILKHTEYQEWRKDYLARNKDKVLEWGRKAQKKYYVKIKDNK